MNTGTLLTRIRLEQRSLIDINKKLYELEHLLPAPAPEQFIKTAKSAALLSERSTAQLRNFLFTVCGGMPQDYYLQAAEMQGIRLNVDDDILSVRLPALLLKKTRTEGFKFLQPAIHAALKQYAEQQNLPHFCECTICIEHIYDRCLPIKAVRDYDNLEMKEVLDIIALYCMTDDTGALCDQFQTTRFADSSCTIICNGVQREHNKKLNNGLPILHKVPPKRDYGRYFCIMAEKGGTSHGGLTEKLSPFFHAKKQEVNAYGR